MGAAFERLELQLQCCGTTQRLWEDSEEQEEGAREKKGRACVRVMTCATCRVIMRCINIAGIQ